MGSLCSSMTCNLAESVKQCKHQTIGHSLSKNNCILCRYVRIDTFEKCPRHSLHSTHRFLEKLDTVYNTQCHRNLYLFVVSSVQSTASELFDASCSPWGIYVQSCWDHYEEKGIFYLNCCRLFLFQRAVHSIGLYLPVCLETSHTHTHTHTHTKQFVIDTKDMYTYIHAHVRMHEFAKVPSVPVSCLHWNLLNFPETYYGLVSHILPQLHHN